MVPTSAVGTVPQFRGSSGLVPASASKTYGYRPNVVVPASPTYNWPELHANPQLTGYSPNSTLTTANASSLGVGWSVDLYGSSLDTPAVAYDSISGRTYAYVGTETGNFLAINVGTGRILWSTWLGSIIRSSPLVWNGSVYAATFTNPEVVRLNASTGAVQARVVAPTPIEGTPTLATPPGGVPTIYVPSLDSGNSNGPLLALNAVTLSTEWTYSKYNSSSYGSTAGSWDSASYGVTKSGVPLVIWGTDNPDSSVYAVNALTGKLVWWFQAYNPNRLDFDVASGPMISLPGVNGFAQGVVYVINKIARIYALDLNNGTLIWETNFRGLSTNSSPLSRSTAALEGTNVVFGYGNGLMDVNATTGKFIWQYKDPTQTESISSPAIVGPASEAVVVTGDVGGSFDVVSLATGHQLYTYATGGYITSSPALCDGNVILASSDGFLYDFVVNGGNGPTAPTTSISSPGQYANVTNPNGFLTVHGNATASGTVYEVEVAIQSGGPTGPWWDAINQTWSFGPITDLATLQRSSASTAWTERFPVPNIGGTYQVVANTVSTAGLTDTSGADVTFDVAYSLTEPTLQISPSYVAQNSNMTIQGGGFPANLSLSLELQDKTLVNLTTSASGKIVSTVVHIAETALFGLSSVEAVAANGTSLSSAPVTISNSWDQQGEAPSHVAYEAYDRTFSQLTYPGHGVWVQVAWHFDAGTAIDSAPVIADGFAYFGDMAGSVFAVDIHNGGLLWSYALPNGAGIPNSPAIDVSRGLLFVGDNSGNLTALSITTGTVLWHDVLGGNVTAPVFDNGQIYLVAHRDRLESISEATGAVAWTRNFASSSFAAPGFNATANVLVVSETSGNVAAFNASNGRIKWTYVTGAQIQDSPVVVGGLVYVGSDSKFEYAIYQVNGTLDWKFNAHASVTDPVALVYKQSAKPFAVVVGSSNSHVYVLSGTTGVQLFNVTAAGPLAGVSAVPGVILFSTLSGTVASTRSYLAEDAVFWHYTSGIGMASAPVLLDGTIYQSSEDGNLYAFTSYGQEPA
ncbi:MAG: PQQ-binding-like beta-propeller repeat protein [Thermoplasmata archaeon]